MVPVVLVAQLALEILVDLVFLDPLEDLAAQLAQLAPVLLVVQGAPVLLVVLDPLVDLVAQLALEILVVQVVLVESYPHPRSPVGRSRDPPALLGSVLRESLQ